MFYKSVEEGYKTALEGIQLKALVHGENTMLCEFRLEGGRMLPSHSHPHEQTGYLISGRLNLIIGGERFETAPGDSWNIPGDVEHMAEILEDAVVIEVFYPVREDYLP
jgi:quercetin dioxygenase-like cupin family protein